MVPSLPSARKLPYLLALRAFPTPSLIWSKGIGEFCDFAGPRSYRLAPTESTQPEAFFARNYRGAHWLVWVRLGTRSRHDRTCDLDAFVKAALPTIDKPFVLVTTDGDATVPADFRPETVAALTGHPLLVGWYSQNCDGSHPSIRPFPVGLDLHTPRPWTTPGGLVALIERLGRQTPHASQRRLRIFCDLNLLPTDARREAIEALRDCEHVDMAAARISQTAIWRRYADYPFVLSTHGNGLDCHRTWELLLLGCIVITKTSSLDPLYEGLPVVIVDDWREARDTDKLRRWIEEYGPLANAAKVRQKLNPEAWLRPLRERLVSTASPAFQDALASSGH